MEFWLKLKQYRPSQNSLYILFLLLMMLPSLALSLTEPMNLWVKIASIMFPLSFLMLGLVIFRKPGYFFVFLFFVQLINGYQLVLLYLFNQAVVSPDMFLTIFTSDSGESGELMGLIWPIVLLACIIYFSATVLGIISIFSKQKLTINFVKKCCITACFPFMLGCVTLIINYSKGFDFSLNHDVYPVNAVYNLYFAGNKIVKTTNHLNNNKEFRFHASKPKSKVDTECSTKREVYVLMVGETSRAANWQLYGYGRDTNPGLSDRDDLIVCTDALTEANITHKIVPMILSHACSENFEEIYRSKSVVSAFKEAGFKTAFISNQIPDKSFIDNFRSEADTIIELYKKEKNMPHPQDFEVVAHIDNLLKNTQESIFIVFHSYGSHFEYSQRFEDEDVKYVPYKANSFKIKNRVILENAYDNSIRHTDRVISSIINSLEKENVISSMLYLSDHGEDIMDDERNMFLHCAPVPTYYQLHIPFLVWFSSPYKEHYQSKYDNAVCNRTKTVGSKVVFHTVLDIASISTPFLQPEYSLVNDNYESYERFFIDEHDEPVSYIKLGMNERDLRKMRDVGIKVW